MQTLAERQGPCSGGCLPDTAQGMRQGALLRFASSSRTADSLGPVGDIREDTSDHSNIFNPYRGRVILYRGVT